MHSGSCVFASLIMLDIAQYCPRCISVAAEIRKKQEVTLIYQFQVGISYKTSLNFPNMGNSDIYKANGPGVLVSTRHWPKPRADLG